ncbi:hypothetical protein N7539_002920 [Penicillium diatomitis]|uniref:Uncharacterized protein n=1 Tax=Penicillium diatomitis TaxID=2819901 RepID=A0A9X0BZJ4_9EURO|nr:uncharacterized protein N7539_002920 [Penicillium diatomitis]KAJ5491353.1 hypothetical protein N7539_002920 [Penicillium diatomitis]
MSSTTLITFLLMTYPEVRSVKLFGSWDNFARPYLMERDRRMGPGQWRGCHTFTDILSDGSTSDRSKWRTGGLKMGATYWYYYLLDNDREYCNPAEPMTTKCPFLPGQPLNILNVPIILPDSGYGSFRNDGSEGFNYRTMNPEDKFLNPRKPPQPTVARLQTSLAPNYHQNTTPGLRLSPNVHYRSSSQPSSATRRHYHGKDARSVSPPRDRLLAIGCQGANMSKSVEFLSRSIPAEKSIHPSRGGQINPKSGVPNKSSVAADSTSVPSIQTRRAIKMNGLGAGRPFNGLTVETRLRSSVSRDIAVGPNGAMGDDLQISKDPSTMACSSGATTPRNNSAQEKRLPSLPNTPSSVMDEAVQAMDETDKEMSSQILRSHFSSLTTVAPESACFQSDAENSRFSEWSTDTDTEPEVEEEEKKVPLLELMCPAPSTQQTTTASPDIDEWRTPDLSDVGDTSTNTDPNTPHLTAASKPSSPNSVSGEPIPWKLEPLELYLPRLTLSLSSPGLTAGLGIDQQLDEVERDPKRHAALFDALESIDSLSHARSPIDSPILLSDPRYGERGSSDREGLYQPLLSPAGEASMHGNSTMQEIMDELSYLKNMIQAEMDGEPF